MAYYEFQCTNCRRHFTAKQTFAEHDRDPQTKVPKMRQSQDQPIDRIGARQNEQEILTHGWPLNSEGHQVTDWNQKRRQ